LIAWLSGIFSCDNGNTVVNPQDQLKTKLKGTWTIVSATLDNNDITSDFTGFSISFTETGYSISNGGTALPSTGSWAFSGDKTDRIVFDGDLEVKISFSSNDTKLRLEFTIPDTIYDLGRKEVLGGDYVFELTK
jgi:hypothetical protein